MATKSESRLKELIKRLWYPIRNSQVIYGPVLNYRWRKNREHYQPAFDKKFLVLSESIVSELRINGIAFSHVDELFPNLNYEESLGRWCNKHESRLAQKDKKTFLLSYFGKNSHEVLIEKENPFFKFFLSDEILFLCREYLGYLPQLNYLAVEKTIPLPNSNSPQYSQNWHRDPEEKRTLKVFIYINDVDESNGPFIYIKRSQPSSKFRYSKLFPQVLPYGSYPDAVKLQELIDPEDIAVATGKSGTVIFCDTAGIHRGGLATKGERIMATAFYPSRKWSEKPSVKSTSEVNLEDYGKLATEVVF